MGVASFKSIEAGLSRRKFPIVFKKDLLERKKPKDLAEVIYRLMVRNERTVLEDKLRPLGYRHHCTEYRMRSIQDLYAVVNNYTKVDYKYLYDIICEFRAYKNESVLLMYHYCTVIQREVHGGGLRTKEETVRNRLGKRNIIFKK